MRETDAYIVSRRSARSKRSGVRKRPRKALGVLVSALLLITAGICAAVYFMPSMFSRGEAVGGSVSFGGKTFYALATAQTTTRIDALAAAQYSTERGGAGYVYNDGDYKVIAAVYEKESDAKTLASVNDGAFCVEIALPKAACGDNDRRALDYFVGEWFTAVFEATNALNRGTTTDAAAEHTVSTACAKLAALADKAETPRIARALADAGDYSVPSTNSVLSYTRYVQARAIIAVAQALA